jgi:hypothetical protein
VRYTISQVGTGSFTATLAEQITDPLAPESGCCGSAERLAGGDWVMSWGLNPVVTEMNPSGSRVFLLQFSSGIFSYRAVPIPYGSLSRSALRAGMDAQYP